MFSLSKNTTAIDGNGNIIIQGVESSTITVNADNTTELNSLIVKLGQIEQQPGQNPISVLILTSPLEDIENLTDSRELTPKLIHPIKDYYKGKSLQDWKPFGDRSIVQIIQDVAANISRGFIINQLNNYSDSLLDIEIQAVFRYIRKDSILIVDSLSLLNTGNMEIAEMFDDYHVGGCIIVDSCCLDSKEKELLEARQKITKFLGIYLRKVPFAGKIGNDHIKYIEDVNEEYKLTNALFSLAENLGAKPRKEIGGMLTRISKSDLY